MNHMETVGIVVIGRNEGDRLKRCLHSAISCTDRVVYVDSGSTDGSVEFAKSLGVDVLDLDMSVPFTAGRARNAGFEYFMRKYDLDMVQFVDGDCELYPDWLSCGMRYILEHENSVVVFGRLIETDPEASVYNRMCQLEWDGDPGVVKSCGGIALYRVDAFVKAGKFYPEMIAGEEPELCVRLRRNGGQICRIAHPMAKHDADMTSFTQYWKRAKRAGHAYAQGAQMHGKPPERHGVRQTRSAIVWGLALPLGAIVLAYWTLGLSVLAYLGLATVQGWRIRRNELRRGRSKRDASLLAWYIMLAKFAQAQGVLLFHWRRITGKQATLIEYKGADQRGTMHG